MRILVFGDSITQGFHDELEGGWCNRLIAYAMRQEVESSGEYDKSVINLGISGDTSVDLLKRVKTETEARVLKYPTASFDVALIAIGVNDTQYDMDTEIPKLSISETIENLNGVIAICEQLNLKIVFVGPAPVFESRIQPMAWKVTHGYSNALIKERAQAISDLASQKQCDYIDMEAVYEGSEEIVLPDGIHPNSDGHEMIYNHLLSHLQKLEIL